jgi:hypothetical protein
MPPRMTATAWAQGAKNALVCGGGVLLVWLGIAVVISWGFDQSIPVSFGFAFAVLWCTSFLVWLVTWLYGLNSGGQVLLDCGPHPTRVLFLANAAIFLIMGLSFGLSGTSVLNIPEKVISIAGPVFGSTFAVFMVFMATGRLQLRENGIWVYWSLLRWGKIDSYHWAADSTLMVRAKGGLSSLLQGAIPVPPEYEQAVDELLLKNCPDCEKR